VFRTGIHLAHFAAMALFALLVSVALASLGRHTFQERLKYAVWTFLLFLIVGVGIAWLMYPLSR